MCRVPKIEYSYLKVSIEIVFLFKKKSDNSRSVSQIFMKFMIEQIIFYRVKRKSSWNISTSKRVVKNKTFRNYTQNIFN